MHKRVTALIEYGALCGFSCDGLNGRGHFRLVHPNGAVVRIPSTPGDYRGDDNARAEMRRLSGVSPERPNAGRPKKGLGRAKAAPHLSSPAEVARSAELNRLRTEHNRVVQQLMDARDRGDMRAAAPLAGRLERCRNRLAELGADVPLIPWSY
jgi:hypothetical protein